MNNARQAAYQKQSAVSAMPAALTAISVLAGLAAVLVNVYIITLLWNGESLNRVIALGMTVCVLQIVKAIFNSLALWKAHEDAYSALSSIRSAMIDHLKKLPLSFFQRRKTGELAGIVDHDVERIEMYLAHTLPEVLSTCLVCVLSFAALAIVDWHSALMVTIPCLARTAQAFRRRKTARFNSPRFFEGRARPPSGRGNE